MAPTEANPPANLRLESLEKAKKRRPRKKNAPSFGPKIRLVYQEGASPIMDLVDKVQKDVKDKELVDKIVEEVKVNYNVQKEEDAQDKVQREVKDEVQEKVEDKVQQEVKDEVEEKAEHKVQNEVGDKVQDEVKDKVQEVDAQVQVEEKVEDKVQDEVNDEVQEKGEVQVQDEVKDEVKDDIKDKVQDEIKDEVQVQDEVEVKDDIKDKVQDEVKDQVQEKGEVQVQDDVKVQVEAEDRVQEEVEDNIQEEVQGNVQKKIDVHDKVPKEVLDNVQEMLENSVMEEVKDKFLEEVEDKILKEEEDDVIDKEMEVQDKVHEEMDANVQEEVENKIKEGVEEKTTPQEGPKWTFKALGWNKFAFFSDPAAAKATSIAEVSPRVQDSHSFPLNKTKLSKYEELVMPDLLKKMVAVRMEEKKREDLEKSDGKTNEDMERMRAAFMAGMALMRKECKNDQKRVPGKEDFEELADVIGQIVLMDKEGPAEEEKAPEKSLRCPICSLSTPKMAEHLSEEHRLTGAAVCPSCDTLCLSESGLTFHIAREHKVGDVVFYCPYCPQGGEDKVFHRKFIALRHVYSCHDEVHRARGLEVKCVAKISTGPVDRGLMSIFREMPKFQK